MAGYSAGGPQAGWQAPYAAQNVNSWYTPTPEEIALNPSLSRQPFQVTAMQPSPIGPINAAQAAFAQQFANDPAAFAQFANISPNTAAGYQAMNWPVSSWPEYSQLLGSLGSTGYGAAPTPLAMQMPQPGDPGYDQWQQEIASNTAQKAQGINPDTGQFDPGMLWAARGPQPQAYNDWINQQNAAWQRPPIDPALEAQMLAQAGQQGAASVDGVGGIVGQTPESQISPATGQARGGFVRRHWRGGPALPPPPVSRRRWGGALAVGGRVDELPVAEEDTTGTRLVPVSPPLGSMSPSLPAYINALRAVSDIQRRRFGLPQRGEEERRWRGGPALAAPPVHRRWYGGGVPRYQGGGAMPADQGVASLPGIETAPGETIPRISTDVLRQDFPGIRYGFMDPNYYGQAIDLPTMAQVHQQYPNVTGAYGFETPTPPSTPTGTAPTAPTGTAPTVPAADTSTATPAAAMPASSANADASAPQGPPTNPMSASPFLSLGGVTTDPVTGRRTFVPPVYNPNFNPGAYKGLA